MNSFYNFNIFIISVVLLFFSVLKYKGYKILRFISLLLLVYFVYNHYKYFGISRNPKDKPSNFYINQLFGLFTILLIIFIIYHIIF
jgi:hypothetical protein